jgi:hypothetical protein
MNRRTKPKLNQRRRMVQLAFTTGLALLFLAVLLWGLQGVTPVRADPDALYVDGTTGSDDSDCRNATDPCATIGYTLIQAGNGDEIHVAEGTYTETVDIAITVTLKGAYAISGTQWLPRAGETIVDGNGADEPVIAIYPRSVVTVDGFIVQGANHVSDAGGGIGVDRATAVVSGTVVRNNTASGGGGVSIEKWEGYPGSLLLINSSLLTNTASQEGGGFISQGWPTVTLDNVEVRGNTAQNEGGGLYVGRVTITNSRIISNTSGGPGGGIRAVLADIYDSEISHNEVNGVGDINGGGINVVAVGLFLQDSVVSSNRVVGTVHSGASGIAAVGANVTIINTRISDNETGDTTIGLSNCPFTITNALVVNNDGHGISSDEVPLTGTMTNATIAGNTNNGIQLTGGDVHVSNSILWGNGGSDNECSGNCTITYSDIGTGDTSGTGNISQDPLFKNATNGDYHLGVGSPCIDAGTLIGAPPADIEGTSRDLAPDMGAYEWTGFRIFLPSTLRSFGP